MPQPRQVNVTQLNPQPLQWACPNADYLAQIIEPDLNMQFFWLVPAHCPAKKINSKPCRILSLILGPKSGQMVFLLSPNP